MVEDGIHSIIHPKVNTTQRLVISNLTDHKMVMAITTAIVIQFRLPAGNHPHQESAALPVGLPRPLRVPTTITIQLTLPLDVDKEISNTIVVIPDMVLHLIDDGVAGVVDGTSSCGVSAMVIEEQEG